MHRIIPLVLFLAFALGCRPQIPPSGPTEPPSILLVVLDTVRRDFAGTDHGRDGSAPNFDRLATQGTRFSAAWSTAPWTVPSHASIFTGELPSVHGANSHEPRLMDQLPTLAEILTAHGWRTAAFFSNPWLSDEASGVLRGFEERVFLPENAAGTDQGGRAILQAADQWLASGASRQEPFFLFVNFLEAHVPYDPPLELRSQLEGVGLAARVSVDWIFDFQAGLISPEETDWQRHRQLYRGDVLHADAFLGELVDLLDQRGLLDHITLLVTSDHGESLGEHGFVEHQFRVDEPLLAVPLVVRAPHLQAVGERRDPVLLTDLFPTVLELAGAAEATPISSRSLLGPPADPRRPLVAEYSGAPPQLLDFLAARNPEFDRHANAKSYRTVRVGHLRLTLDSEGGTLLHDLAADPDQTENIATERPRAVAALRQLLDDVAAEAPEVRADGPAELSDETRERLRALGYIR